ncbi:hypothetical protein CIG75_04035 [Tumebacillus algifaecis]|uniref:AraC effector-binding domain-containing protein n=1 Tax=Tumebacillus algifaecis TaxID=1214604 RepID=A0A223CYN5_9BACL|nr:GyrI-like domain-containing protein [Tumebacillus algifaecis]ASS74233.1 hypothetical protein CIG75_04035 [Tumebacillus algifaecis]
MMEPKVVTKNSMKLVGIAWSGAYADAKEIPALWIDFVARAEEISERVSPEAFISPCHGRQTEFTCYLTAEVADFTTFPEGMKGITIPAQTYVQITHRGPMTAVEATYTRLYRWIEENGYQPNRAELWLEVYDERYNSAKHDPNRAENEYDIFMPIIEKQG